MNKTGITIDLKSDNNRIVLIRGNAQMATIRENLIVNLRDISRRKNNTIHKKYLTF